MIKGLKKSSIVIEMSEQFLNACSTSRNYNCRTEHRRVGKLRRAVLPVHLNGDLKGMKRDALRSFIAASQRVGRKSRGTQECKSDDHITQSMPAAISTMPTSSTIVTVLMGNLNTVPRQAH